MSQIYIARWLSFFIGFLSLSQEIIWVRLLNFKLRGMPQAFSFVLSFFLVGIALGAHLGKKVCHRTNLINITIFLILISAVLDICLPKVLSMSMLLSAQRNYMPYEIINLASIAFFITISAGIKAAIFPIAHHLGSDINSKNLGKSISYVYFANIFGSTLGPIITGFYILDNISTESLFTALGISELILAISIMAYHINKKFLFFLPLCLFSLSSINLHETKLISSIADKLDINKISNIIENKYGIIHTLNPSDDLQFIFGGNMYDGQNNLDLFKDTNLISRLYILGAVHRNPEKILIIGLSGGAWTKVLSSFPNTKEIDVVEINPGYIDLIKKDTKINTILKDGRIKIHIDDGRRWLKRNPSKKFDLIVMNSTFHWRTNNTNLLSLEFNSLIKKHLNIKGIFAYNGTHSIDAFYTTSKCFTFAYRYLGFIYASDYDFSKISSSIFVDRMNKLSWPDTKEQIFKNKNTQLQKKYKSFLFVKIEDDVLESERKPEIVTDANMITEFKYGLLNQMIFKAKLNAEQ
jgi:spermidine synthase